MPDVDFSDIGRKVIGVFSLPRLMPTEIAFNAIEVAGILGIKMRRNTSAYWSESLTGCMEEARDAGAEFVLTVDYDTPHRVEDVARLYALMRSYDRADAIAALQVRRNCNEVLAAVRDPVTGTLPNVVPGHMFSDELVRVVSAHFGLTLIRVDALRRMPKPWFYAKPDKNGEWHDGHVPADMNFWRMFESVGNSLFIAMKVPVAHMEWVRTWPGPDFKARYQSEADFAANGIPEEIRDGKAWIGKK
jgi:hypothetical protein